MKFQLIVISLILAITNQVSFAQDDCPLKGRWKSNADKTIQEMVENNKYSDEQMERLSSEIIGKLIVEYTCTEHITYYEGQTHLFSYTILKRDGNILTVQYIDKECDNAFLGKDIDSSESCSSECDNAITEQEIYLNGDCYSVLYDVLGYSEVFCRTN